MKINLHHNELYLLPEKAVLSPLGNTLFIADAHLGKTSTFRKAGIPVPEGSQENDLYRLDGMITKYSAKQIVFLGDLFHSEWNHEWDIFSTWRASHVAIAMTLVVGNHDILSPSDYDKATLKIEKEPFLWNELALRHHPLDDGVSISQPVLCGHTHPGVRVSSSGKFTETLPCFLLRGMHLTLPAFGSFTGLSCIAPKSDDRIFIPAESEVFEIS